MFPKINFSTLQEVSGIEYSGTLGVSRFAFRVPGSEFKVPGSKSKDLCSVIVVAILLKTISGSNPVRIIVPASWASGRSIDCLIETAGNDRIADSSLMVPLSEIVQRACCCK